MIKEIKNVSSERLLFDTIGLYPDINLLIGGNGVGKTTLINHIKNGHESIKIKGDISKLKVWANSEDNHRYANPNPYGDEGKYSEELIGKFQSGERSEGENVIHCFINWLEANLEEGVVFVIDEVDSGLSVDNINAVLCIIANMTKTHDVQFILSVNSWHPVYAFDRSICLMTGDRVSFEKDYERFCKYSFKTAEELYGIRTKQKEDEQRDIDEHYKKKERKRPRSSFKKDVDKNTKAFTDRMVSQTPKETTDDRVDRAIKNIRSGKAKRKYNT